MGSIVRTAILFASAPCLAQLIADPSGHITDNNFVNLFKTIDINTSKKFNYVMFLAFTSAPSLQEQVAAWPSAE